MARLNDHLVHSLRQKEEKCYVHKQKLAVHGIYFARFYRIWPMNTTKTDHAQGVWKILLAVAAAIWGGSFVVIKGALDVVPAAWLMFVRFLGASLIVGLIFNKELRAHLDRSHLLCGAVLGLFSGSAFVIQNVGLSTISPGRNAFLTATYCVMVPFINWGLSRRRPGLSNVFAAVLAIGGIGLLSLGDDLSFSLSFGEWLTLASAVLYALHIVAVSRFSLGHDVMTMTIIQLAVSALVSLVCALAIGDPLDLAVFAQPSMWGALAYLILLSSCVCMVLQNLGQAHVPPAQASLLLSLESVFAVIASVVFYGEVVTPRLAAGFVSIFVAVLVSELAPSVKERFSTKKA